MSDTDRVWANPHPDAPTNADDVPVHPEKGYPICAYEKTDAVDEVNDAKREDIPYCLQAAGWGTDRDTGHCRAHHGGSTGAPEGWANGAARHLLYSKRMNDDDREVFRRLVDTGDGDLVPVDEFAKTLQNMIAFEEMRLSRAVGITPGVDMITQYRCPECGETYRMGTDDDPVVDCDGSVRVAPQTIEPCHYTGELDKVAGKSWVDFGDKAVERKEAHVANLIQTLVRVTEGATVNVSGDHDVTVEGGDDPVEVNITSVGVDLPTDEQTDTDDEGGEE